jgi:HAE1 family hydrophobic/amphiphilic exporter-1/multidrug efflux pump
MSVSTPFIQRPVATSLLMIAILLAGAISYPALPIAPLPQVDYPTILVSAGIPGASPETMASSVATPLERQIAQISGISQMTSTSALGLTNITVQFDLSRNIDGAAQDIQAAINASAGQLSKNLPNPPVFRKVNPADTPIFIIAVTSDNHTITETDDYADSIIAQQISQLSGVAQVLILGGAEARDPGSGRCAQACFARARA